MFSFGRRTTRSVDDILAGRPSWVARQLKPSEAKLLTSEISKAQAKTACEIGVASGFTSAVLFSALAENTSRPHLYGFDLATTCYYDPTHNTGDAFFELHGDNSGYHLQTGVTSADITAPSHKLDFVLIDADHRSPWPALDLLSISRFLSPNAVIALHDTEIIFQGRWRDMNGPRDLYRAWLGEKWCYQRCPNIAFLRYGDASNLAEAVAITLLMDWDRRVEPSVLAKYEVIAQDLPQHGRDAVMRALERRRSTQIAPLKALDGELERKLAPPSYLFIVSYGRSGSTLIQKIVGSIPGYHIVGENHDVLFGLYQGYERALRTKRKYGKAPLPLDDPWHGADKVNPKNFAKSLKRAFVNEILKPPLTARVIGFKEVRYFEHQEEFDSFLKFMLRFFTPGKIIFNVRSAKTIEGSAWWRDYPYDEVERMIANYEAMVDDFVQAKPDNCFKVSYDDYAADPQILSGMFDFLGEEFDRKGIEKIISVQLKHGRAAKRPTSR